MTELVRIDAERSLTEKQALFVAELLKGTDEAEALRIAGYAETVLPSHVLASGTVKAAIDAGCKAKLSGSLKLKALRTLEALLDGGPAATKFNAAKLILEQSEDHQAEDKPLSELSIPELERLIARKERELKDVTPGNGAHQPDPAP